MNKKKFKTVSVITLLVLCVIIFIFYRNWHSNKFSLKIGEEVIQEEEYLQVMNDIRQEVLMYFREQYRVTVTNKDWGTSVDGEIPSQVLAHRVTEKLRDHKAIYALAKQRGYVDSTSYKSLIKRMDEENARRKAKIDSGQIVYGLSAYSPHTYLEYEMDSFEKRFCEEEKTEASQYEDAIQKQKKNSKVEADAEQLYAFTLKNITAL